MESELGERDRGGWEVEFLLVFMPASSLQGCLETITTWLRKNVLLVAAAALGIAFVEVRDAVGCGGLNQPRACRGQEALRKLPLPPLHPHPHLSFQVLGVIFSCCLVKSIRSGYEVM